MVTTGPTRTLDLGIRCRHTYHPSGPPRAASPTSTIAGPVDAAVHGPRRHAQHPFTATYEEVRHDENVYYSEIVYQRGRAIPLAAAPGTRGHRRERGAPRRGHGGHRGPRRRGGPQRDGHARRLLLLLLDRSEERRVGKEWRC